MNENENWEAEIENINNLIASVQFDCHTYIGYRMVQWDAIFLLKLRLH